MSLYGVMQQKISGMLSKPAEPTFSPQVTASLASLGVQPATSSPESQSAPAIPPAPAAQSATAGQTAPVIPTASQSSQSTPANTYSGPSSGRSETAQLTRDQVVSELSPDLNNPKYLAYQQWERDALKAGANFASQDWYQLSQMAQQAAASGQQMPPTSVDGLTKTYDPNVPGNYVYSAPSQAGFPSAVSGGSQMNFPSGGQPQSGSVPPASSGGPAAGTPAPGGGIYNGQGGVIGGPEGSYQGVLDPQSMTVEGRMQGLLARGNPLLELAMTRAQQQANARGLLNSSIAAESGQAAVIQNAMPIATQDAAQYFQNLQNNVAGANQLAGINRQEAGATARQAAGDAAAMARQQASDAAALARTQEQTRGAIEERQVQGQIDLQKQTLIDQTNLAMKEIEAEFQNQIRASATTGQIYQQMQTNIANIQINDKLDASAKARLIEEQIQLARGGLQIAGALANNLNLVEQLDAIVSAPARTRAPEAPPGGPGTVAGGNQQLNPNYGGVWSTESQS